MRLFPYNSVNERRGDRRRRHGSIILFSISETRNLTNFMVG